MLCHFFETIENCIKNKSCRLSPRKKEEDIESMNWTEMKSYFYKKKLPEYTVNRYQDMTLYFSPRETNDVLEISNRCNSLPNYRKNDFENHVKTNSNPPTPRERFNRNQRARQYSDSSYDKPKHIYLNIRYFEDHDSDILTINRDINPNLIDISLNKNKTDDILLNYEKIIL